MLTCNGKCRAEARRYVDRKLADVAPPLRAALLAFGNRGWECSRAMGSAGLKPGATWTVHWGRSAALEGGTSRLRQARLGTLTCNGKCRAEARRYVDRTLGA
jgi:hypothetical protein